MFPLPSELQASPEFKGIKTYCFAKRDHAETLRDLRARGVTPGELRAEMGFD